MKRASVDRRAPRTAFGSKKWPRSAKDDRVLRSGRTASRAGHAQRIKSSKRRLLQQIGVLIARALPGQALQRVLLGRRRVDRIKRWPAEARHGAEDMGIAVVGPGMLAQVTAQRL